MTRSMSVTSRPNDEALVTTLPSISFAPAQMYWAWVWPLTITSTSSLTPLAIATISPLMLSQLSIPAEAGDPRRSHDQRRPLERQPDERDLRVLDRADLVGRQDGRVRADEEHVGGE